MTGTAQAKESDEVREEMEKNSQVPSRTWHSVSTKHWEIMLSGRVKYGWPRMSTNMFNKQEISA